MAQRAPRRWPYLVGYPAFAFLALVAAFFLTFPYEALKERLKLEAENAGLVLRIAGLGPGLLGIRATGVEVSRKAEGPEGAPPQPLKLDVISVGPSLFPPGVGVTVYGLGGRTDVQLGLLGGTRVAVQARGLDLAQGNVKGFTGIDFAGVLDATVDVTVPRAAGSSEADLSQASGTVGLSARGLAVNGGTASVTIPQFGPEPTPLDLPRIVIGEVAGKVKLEKGLGTLEELRSNSADLEVQGSGTLKLAKRLEYAEPNLEIRFKPDPEFQKRLGLIGSALSVVAADPKDPAWRAGRLTGFLGRPSFR